MARTTIAASQTDTESPLDQTLMDAIRENDADHESRILTLEDPESWAFSHFVANYGWPSGVIDLTKENVYEGKFFMAVNGGDWVNQIGVSTSADDHYLMLRDNGVGTTSGVLAVAHACFFNNRVKPITFRVRVKFSDFDDSTKIWIGLCAFMDAATDTATEPTDYIALCKGASAGKLRFSSRVGSGVTNDGGDFTPPADGTWWEVKIVFTNDPSNKATCYTDDGAGNYTTRETLTASLPVAANIYGMAAVNQIGVNDTMKADRMDLRFGGAIADAA